MSTGKTTVLLGKARELALRGEAVLVIVFNMSTDVKSLLHLELEAKFREEVINIEVTVGQMAVTTLYPETVSSVIGPLLQLDLLSQTPPTWTNIIET